jgi:hypothetical protein
VTRLVKKMRDVMPWIEQADIPAARAWAEMEYLAGQVYAVLRAMHPVIPDGEARRLLDDYRKLRQTQAVFARELGMTPASRMALKASGTSAALDLAEIAAPVSERVIEVARSRSRTTECDEDDDSGRGDRTNNQPAGIK